MYSRREYTRSVSLNTITDQNPCYGYKYKKYFLIRSNDIELNVTLSYRNRTKKNGCS